jgi:16S rRNA G527 N7-methylase RsmG
LGTTLEGELERLGLFIPQDAREKLETYVQELERWTRTVNLTALKGGALVRRLVAEPAWIGSQLQMSGNLVDVGSGNGCPGIPLYVTCRLNRVELIEARVRRAAFLRHIGSLLSPHGIIVHRIRLEDMQRLPQVTDWISLQAVDPNPTVVQSLQRLFSPTTRVVWITSKDAPPTKSATSVSVPRSNTVAWVSKLDQF